MAVNPLISLDLPLKVVAFNDPLFISSRYSITLGQDSPLNLQPMIEYILKNEIR